MAILVAHCLSMAKDAWSAVVPARITFWNVVISVCLLCKPGVDLWRETFDDPDVVAQMLK
jgi:hypothetical protein